MCVVIWAILCAEEEEDRIYSAFRSLSPGPPSCGEGGSTNNVCKCILVVCVCVKKGQRGSG